MNESKPLQKITLALGTVILFAGCGGVMQAGVNPASSAHTSGAASFGVTNGGVSPDYDAPKPAATGWGNAMYVSTESEIDIYSQAKPHKQVATIYPPTLHAYFIGLAVDNANYLYAVWGSNVLVYAPGATSPSYDIPLVNAQHGFSRVAVDAKSLIAVDFGNGSSQETVEFFANKTSRAPCKTVNWSGEDNGPHPAFSPSGELYVLYYATGSMHLGKIVGGCKATKLVTVNLNLPSGAIDVKVDSGGNIDIEGANNGTTGVFVFPPGKKNPARTVVMLNPPPFSAGGSDFAFTKGEGSFWTDGVSGSSQLQVWPAAKYAFPAGGNPLEKFDLNIPSNGTSRGTLQSLVVSPASF